MPQFFSKDNLTEEQKVNWENAINNYNKVMEINAQKELNKMSVKDKAKFMSSFKIKDFDDNAVLEKMKSSIMVMGNPAGHEKSALFFRLLSGEKILKNPPPTSFSYPDYEIVESNDSHELALIDAKNTKELVCKPDKYCDYKHIFLNQTGWKVVEVINDKKLHITHRNWEDLGFIWELELKTITAQESMSAIIPHHNPSLKKITTKEQLFNESLFKANKLFYKIRLAQDAGLYKEYEQHQIEKYKNLGSAIAQQDLDVGKKLLEQRLKDGLSNYPTDDEIVKYAEEKMKTYLGKDYFIKDDLLYKEAWTIKRINPEQVGEEYYLSL